MSWQEWLGSLLMLLGIGGIVILLAEALCGLLRLDRKRPEPEEFTDADADALVAEISREIEAEAARIARRCEVRR
jgi:predicted nucleic acid-binding protein